MKRHLIVALCAGIGLAGCVENTGATSAPQGTSEAAKLSMAAIGKPKDATAQAAVLHVNKLRYDTAMKILERMCGPRTISRIGDGSYNAQVKKQQKHRDKIPSILECYAQKGEQAWDMRIAQRAYIEVARPALIPTAQAMKQSFFAPYSIESELKEYQKQLAQAPSYMQSETGRNIRYLVRQRSANRDSWSRAFNNAAPSFSRTLNSPTSQSTLAPVRTASLYPNASPAAVIAMDNMDRTVFGDAAVNQRMLDEAARAGRASIARQASSGSTITLTESNYCSTERNSAGKCLSYSEWDAKRTADAESRAAQRRAASLERRSAMAAEAQRVAAERAANLPECHKFGCR